jgi:DNA replication protein DnaC
MAKALEKQLQTRDLDNMAFEDRLGLLVDQEVALRENLRLAARLRHAKLRMQACLEDLDLKPSRGLDRALITSLANSAWIAQHRNVLLTGPTGVGKSYLACALAQQACRDGYTAIYQRMNRLFEGFAIAKASGSYPRHLSALAKKDVLVLDDFALVSLTHEQRNDLFEVIEDRYQRRSTIVVSQVPVEQWYESIGDPTFADAILDRLIHNAYKFCLKGESLRKKLEEEVSEKK